MRHSDRRVAKTILRRSKKAARKEENQENVMSPKPSEENVSWKRKSSAELSTVRTEPLTIGFSYIVVPGYAGKNSCSGVVIVRVGENTDGVHSRCSERADRSDFWEQHCYKDKQKNGT